VRRIRASFIAMFAAFALIVIAEPSHASDGHVGAGPAGALGGMYVDFTGTYSANLSNISLQDSKCDSHPVYMSLWATDTRGFHREVTDLYTNNWGCGSIRSFPNTSFGITQPLANVRLMVCVQDWGLDTCRTSARLDNPYT